MPMPTPIDGESQSDFIKRCDGSKSIQDEYPDRMSRIREAFGTYHDHVYGLSKLTTEERKKIPKSDFALPGGRYPIPDRSHAQNALARVSQFGTPAEKSVVRRKVHEKYPDMGKDD